MGITHTTNKYLYPLKIYKKRGKKRNHFLLVSLFCFIAIFQSGLRDINNLPDGNDTLSYRYSYEIVSKTSWSSLIRNFSLYTSEYKERDFGYPIFTKATQLIYDDFTFYMFLVAIIFLIPFSAFIYKYVKTYLGISLAFLIYFSIYTNIVNSFMRQAISLGLFLYGLKYIINSNWKKYYSLLTVAFFIHFSAIIAAPLYFLPKFIKSRYALLIILVFTPLLMIYTPFLVRYLSEGTVYENYGMGVKLNPINYILLLLFAGMLTLRYYKKIEKLPDASLLIAGIAGSTILIPIIWMGGTILRVSYYYSIFIIPLFPVVFDNMNRGKHTRLMAYFVGISFFLYIILK